MADWQIKLKRGNSGAAPPDSLEPGEPAIELDSGILWYGNGDAEPKRVKIDSSQISDKGNQDGIASLDGRGNLPGSQLPVKISTDAPVAGTNDSGTNVGDLWLRYDPNA